MTGFLAELGKKLADRWVALLVLPGLLFTAVAAAAVTLGQRHWADAGALTALVGRVASTGADRPDGLTRTVLLLVGLLVASFASGMLARALGVPVEHALAGRWPRPLRGVAGRLRERRRRAWTRADQRCREARDAGDRDALGDLVRRRNGIALIEPRCPTWIGDRLTAPAVRVRDEYGLDLGFAWPRLWLLLPESTRTPLTEGRRRLDDATALGGWALLYLALGSVWWPAAVAGAAAGLVAWRRSRAAAAVYAELVEAAVDVHVGDLLDRFADDSGVRPARPQWGAELTERFRKGV
ncbi:hypothetical protein [Gandjariella thermophila]|uniref:Vegetative cell wall protein gp1 n=1 Tax=Gandjariella thermophila TaxID=1931992 RepID=A0A4D4JDT7_9PSEU|nr:hypothetical protein [Gandjariella thermophila]GDY32063.1 hypothetical protein GTS_36960 [Gandjariella thermophila]